MSTPSERPGEPSVYGRLASESELRFRSLTPPRGIRLAGWAICLAVAVVTVVAALRVPI